MAAFPFRIRCSSDAVRMNDTDVCTVSVPPFAALGHHVERGVHHIDVVPGAAVHAVVAQPTIQQIAADTAQQRVIAIVAVKAVVPVQSSQQVDAARPDDLVSPRRCRCRCGLCCRRSSEEPSGSRGLVPSVCGGE